MFKKMALSQKTTRSIDITADLAGENSTAGLKRLQAGPVCTELCPHLMEVSL